eukprot:gene12601-6421_t
MFYNNIGDLTNDVQAHSTQLSVLIRLKSRFIVSGDHRGEIKIFDENGNLNKTLPNIHMPPIKGIVELSNGYIATYGEDYIIKIWDPTTLKVIYNLKGHSSSIFNVFDLSDGTIVSGSDDLTIKFWRNETCFKNIFFEKSSNRISDLFKLSPNRFASTSPIIIYDEKGSIVWRMESETNEPILQIGNELVIKDRSGKISFYNDKGDKTASFAYPYPLEKIYPFNGGFIFKHSQYIFRYTKSGQRTWMFQSKNSNIILDDEFSLVNSGFTNKLELYVRK